VTCWLWIGFCIILSIHVNCLMGWIHHHILWICDSIMYFFNPSNKKMDEQSIHTILAHCPKCIKIWSHGVKYNCIRILELSGSAQIPFETHAQQTQVANLKIDSGGQQWRGLEKMLLDAWNYTIKLKFSRRNTQRFYAYRTTEQFHDSCNEHQRHSYNELCWWLILFGS